MLRLKGIINKELVPLSNLHVVLVSRIKMATIYKGQLQMRSGVLKH